ncbi:MAG: hypothetical protein JST68_29165 [Bacteroidetes bacterium]|nr:hypothetical protein [Bacteroidota bacterium]
MTDQKNKQPGMPDESKKSNQDMGKGQRDNDMPQRSGDRTGARNAEIENPDEPDRKKVELDDNPDETRRKIPNMHK